MSRTEAALMDAAARIEALVAEIETLRVALTEYENCASWYIRCLEDAVTRKPVRGLAEAKAGYDSARAALAAARGGDAT
jgi:hypothetical protein